MPSCSQMPAASVEDDSEIQAAAARLTESTLKRALTQLISEAIEVETTNGDLPSRDHNANTDADEQVEAVARNLVTTVLCDSWATFLDSCDLEEWLAQASNAPLSHRMARDLLRQVQTDGLAGHQGGVQNLKTSSIRPPPTTPTEEAPSGRANVDLDFFQSPREHSNTDSLYPKSNASRSAEDDSRHNGGEQARRSERGAAGGPASDCGSGEEIRFRFDNSDCRIDLRLVRPYAGVLAHTNSIDKEGNEVAVLLFDSSHLPARSVADYDHLMQQLFLYSMFLVEQHMYSNYSIVYLHGNAAKDHWPRAKWLRQWCHALNSKTTKHLTQMFVVFPTLWIRTLRFISRPFVKFKPSIHFMTNVKSLLNHLPEADAIIPNALKQAEGL